MMPTRSSYPLVLILILLFFSACAPAEEQDSAEEQSEAMAQQHEGDTPDPTALVLEPRIPVDAFPVDYATLGGEAVVGYLAKPIRQDSVAEEMGMAPGDTSLPAVLLIHEWWGLNDNVRTMARRLAGEGYRVLAVDLYGGQTADTPDEAQLLMRTALDNGDRVEANMRAAYDYVTEQYDAPEVAVMGWCFGGTVALQTAVALPTELDAAVIYYGSVDQVDEDQLATLEMPMIGFFGGQDQSIPVEDVRAFESTLEEMGKNISVYVYEDAGHAFANPSGQNYMPDAARDAWDKTTAFLMEHLYGMDSDAS